MGEATDFKFGRWFYRVHRNKNPLKNLEKRGRGHIQGLPKVFKNPLLSQLFTDRCVFVAKWYILQQRRLKKWTGSALLAIRRYNFQPPHQSWAPQCTVPQRHRQTDRQLDSYSRLYCVQQHDRLKSSIYNCIIWHCIALYMITTALRITQMLNLTSVIVVFILLQ